MLVERYIELGLPIAGNTSQEVVDTAEQAVTESYISKVEGFVSGLDGYDLTLGRLATCYMIVNNVKRLPNNSVSGAGLNDSATRFERDFQIAGLRKPAVATLIAFATAQGQCFPQFDFILNETIS